MTVKLTGQQAGKSSAMLAQLARRPRGTVTAFMMHAPFPVTETPRELVRPGECAVYAFYDAEGTLLYVGVSWNPYRRWETHRRVAAWWDAAVRATITVYPDEATALRVERELIRTERPLHNVRSARR